MRRSFQQNQARAGRLGGAGGSPRISGVCKKESGAAVREQLAHLLGCKCGIQRHRYSAMRQNPQVCGYPAGAIARQYGAAGAALHAILLQPARDAFGHVPQLAIAVLLQFSILPLEFDRDGLWPALDRLQKPPVIVRHAAP